MLPSSSATTVDFSAGSFGAPLIPQIMSPLSLERPGDRERIVVVGAIIVVDDAIDDNKLLQCRGGEDPVVSP